MRARMAISQSQALSRVAVFLLLVVLTPGLATAAAAYCNVTFSGSSTISSDIATALNTTSPGVFRICLQYATYTGCDNTFPVTMQTAAGYAVELDGIPSVNRSLPVVDCENSDRFITISSAPIGQIVVSNIEFTRAFATGNTGSVVDCSGSPPTILLSGVAVTDSRRPVTLVSCDAVIAGCRFESTTGLTDGGSIRAVTLASLTIADCTFSHSTSTSGHGGALYADTVTTLTITNTVASNCAAPALNDGGGAFSIEDGNIYSSNNTFVNNAAYHYGGGLYCHGTGHSALVNNTFIGNSARRGGGFRTTADTSVVTNLIAIDNTADEGGGIELRAVDLTIEHSFFLRNYGDVNGGGISMYSFCTAIVLNCVFEDNVVVDGTLAVGSDCVCNVAGSNFTGNNGYQGGAIALYDPDASLTVENSTFFNNTAVIGGDIHSIPSTTVQLTTCNLTGGVATQRGGSMELENSGTATDCVFSQSSAASKGGAIYFGVGGTLTLTRCTIKDSASGDGGAIYATSTTTVSVQDTTLEGNSASWQGGGVYLDNGVSCTFEGSVVRDNTATAGYNGSFAHISCGAAPVVVTLTNTTVSCNVGDSVIFVNRSGAAPINISLTNTVVRDNYRALPNGGFDFDVDAPGSVIAPTLVTSVGVFGEPSFTGYVVATDEDPRLCPTAPPCGDSGTCDPDACAFGNNTLSRFIVCECWPGTHGPNCSLYCGDGVVQSDAGELCDDGNGVDGDGCDNNCEFSCGNGALDVGNNETCDDGNTVDGDACSNNCSLNCGNGVVDVGNNETCDDGNSVDGDGCDNNCTRSCGNGVHDAGNGEECDDGNNFNGDGCDNNCTFSCGNGMHDVGNGEECDDGNSVNGDGCDNNCTLSCGNGIHDVGNGEDCDDGNSMNGDGCDNNCRWSCGNGVTNEANGEECDDGNTNDNDGCKNDCTKNIFQVDAQCEEEQWRIRRSGECVECPIGGHCDGSVYCYPMQGFWSKSPFHEPVQCGTVDACPGVVDEDGNFIGELDINGRPITAVCDSNYGDEVCAKCKPKRFKDNQRCVPCAADATSVSGGLVFVSVVIIVVLALAVAVLPDKRLDFLVAIVLAAQMFVLVGRDATRFIPGDAGKRASAVYRYFSIVSFDVDFMQLGCAREEALDFADVFWATLLLVGVSAVLFALAATLNVTARWAFGRLHVPYATAVKYHVVHVFLILGVAAYVQVTMRVLQSINCIDVYGEPRLHVELSTACYGDEHMTIVAVSWILMAVYVVTFPAVVFYIGWVRPQGLRGSTESSTWHSLSSNSVQSASYSGSAGTTSHSSSDASRYGSSARSGYSELDSDSDNDGLDLEEGDVGSGEGVSESVEYESEQQSDEDSGATKASAAEVYAYRAQFGFLVRGLRRHAYWFQALRIVVMFAIVLDLVTPQNTTAKLFGSVMIVAANIITVGVFWPFKNRFINLLQIASGVGTCVQTIIFLQSVADPRHQSLVMVVLSVVFTVVVSALVSVNLFRNQSLFFVESDESSSSWLGSESTNLFFSLDSSHSSYSG